MFGIFEKKQVKKEIETIQVNGFFSSDDLKSIINEKGKDDIRFIAPFRTNGINTPLGFMISSNDPMEDMVCKITESRYKVKDNYKISLTPSDVEWYKEDYYMLDLVSLIERGIIKIVK